MYNTVILIGRLTKDPETRATQSGTNVTSFTLAVNRSFKDANGEYGTDFINCVMWNNSNVEQYCQKGDLIGVRGRVATRSYDNEEGKKVYVTEVVVEKVAFLSTKKDKSEETKEKSNSQIVRDVMTDEDPFSEFGRENPIDDSDLPF